MSIPYFRVLVEMPYGMPPMDPFNALQPPVPVDDAKTDAAPGGTGLRAWPPQPPRGFGNSSLVFCTKRQGIIFRDSCFIDLLRCYFADWLLQ